MKRKTWAAGPPFRSLRAGQAQAGILLERFSFSRLFAGARFVLGLGGGWCVVEVVVEGVCVCGQLAGQRCGEAGRFGRKKMFYWYKKNQVITPPIFLICTNT